MRPALAAALIVLVAPAAARADAVLAQILADSARAPVQGFERTAKAEVRADPEKEPAVVIDRFVPKDAKAGQWTLVSVDGRKPTEQEAAAHAKGNARGVVPGFHRLHLVLKGTPKRSTDAQGRAVYRFDGLPEGAVVTPGGDISKKLSAEAVVDPNGGKPFIAQVRLFAAEPFSIAGVAKMNEFNVVSQYRANPGGFPVLVAQTSTSDVKAPFGMGGKRRTVFSFRPL